MMTAECFKNNPTTINIKINIEDVGIINNELYENVKNAANEIITVYESKFNYIKLDLIEFKDDGTSHKKYEASLSKPEYMLISTDKIKDISKIPVTSINIKNTRISKPPEILEGEKKRLYARDNSVDLIDLLFDLPEKKYIYLCADYHVFEEGLITIKRGDKERRIDQYIAGTGGTELDPFIPKKKGSIIKTTMDDYNIEYEHKSLISKNVFLKGHYDNGWTFEFVQAEPRKIPTFTRNRKLINRNTIRNTVKNTVKNTVRNTVRNRSRSSINSKGSINRSLRFLSKMNSRKIKF
jgi:hypothetical protein